MKNFWLKINKPFFILAPMADVTDWPFRQVVALLGRPDIFYTEFVSADGLSSQKGRIKLLPLLHFTEDERPVIAQIFGARPENIRRTAKLVQQLGFDGLDINMGCPDRKVLKQGAGIALCKTPDLALEIINAAKEGAPHLPISIKTRLGYSTPDLGWIKVLAGSGISALAVHLRTMKEMSKVPAHWELMKEISDICHAHDVLAIGNGDVMSLEEAGRRAEETDMDGIMFGRAIFQNPWLFSGEGPGIPEERFKLLKRHMELFIEFWSRPPFSPEKLGRNFDVLKKFFKMYCSGFDGAAELRARLMECRTADAVSEVLKNKFPVEINQRGSGAGS